MIDIILLSIKTIAILFFVGYGFTAIFIPNNLRNDAFWFTPWFGTILISVLGVIFSLAKVPMIQSAYIILFFSGILFISSLIMRKMLPLFSKEFFFLSILTLFCLGFNLLPLITRAKFPTTISLSNLDPLSYTNVGDFLIRHTVFDGGTFEHYKPFLWPIGDIIHYSYRWGSPMILSFFSVIFDMRSYQIFSILLTIFFALTFPLIYILAKKLSQSNSIYLMVLIFLTYAFNSTILYMLYNVFFGQFIFLGIYILIALFTYSYIYEEKQTIHFNSYDLLIALAISSLTTIYPESLIFVIFPLLFLFIFNFFNVNRTLVLVSIIKILFLSFVINPQTAGTAIQQNLKLILISTKAAFIGWENIRYAAPFEMMGFYNLYYSKDIPAIFDVILGIPVVFIWCVGLIKSKSKAFLLSYLATFIPFYIGLRFIFPNFYSYHRVITYSLFLYSILFSIGAAYFLSRLQKNKILGYILIFIFVGLSARSAYRTIYQLYWHPRIVEKSLVSLNDLNKNQEIKGPFYTSDVYLGEYDIWKRLWREYFLMDKLIVTMQNYPTEKKFLEGISLVLAEKSKLDHEGKKLIFKNIVWQNQYYQLGEITPIDVADNLKDKKDGESNL